ncbi:MAG: T9SS type A sorting domain-containing protein [Saprospiraceae bacterium]|nr:T9SS type A sorting domain-containing protein [Saprospiraceae bacterium]
MKKILIILLLAYLSPCIAQEYRGGEFHFARIDNYHYDVDVDLYYQSPNIPAKDFLVINASTGILDTAYFMANDSITPFVRRLRYHTRLFLPFENQTYIIHVVDSIFLPELVNLDGTGKSFQILQTLLTPPYTQFFGLNSPPVFTHLPTDYYFENGKLIFNSVAEDPDGDTLFYALRDLNLPGFHTYTWPNASDTFLLNFTTGLLTWNKPLYPGKYIVGIDVAEYNSVGYYFGQMRRDVIFEVTEADIVSVQDQIDASEMPFRLSPNPASNEVFISKFPSDSRFEIVDLIGNVMQSGSLSAGTQSLNVSNFTNGIYFVSVFSKGRVWVEKLVVQH